MSVTSNALNITAAGLAKYDGAGAFSGVTTTLHDVLVGAASNGITSVAPSATVGVPLVSGGSSADPSFSTVLAAGGGTGLSSPVAYQLVAAGTSSTGNFQQIALGTAGQVLTSAGAGALAGFADPAAPSSLSTYVNVTGTTQTMAVNKGYIANNAGLVTFTPPAVCAVGSSFSIIGNGAGGWTIDCSANSQTIQLGAVSATTSVASVTRYDTVDFVCTVANTTFVCKPPQGSLTLT